MRVESLAAQDHLFAALAGQVSFSVRPGLRHAVTCLREEARRLHAEMETVLHDTALTGPERLKLGGQMLDELRQTHAALILLEREAVDE